MPHRTPAPPHVQAALARTKTVQLKPQSAPARPAAHVQAAQAQVTQTKPPGPAAAARPPQQAAHVQRAVAGTVQARMPAVPKVPAVSAMSAMPARPAAAPHVRTALQAKPAPAAPRPPAPHVQAAVRGPAGLQPAALQPKAAGAAPRLPPPRAAGVVQRKSEFSNHIIRQIVGSAAAESGLLDNVSASTGWIGQLEDRFLTEAPLPKNDTSEARSALSWLASKIVMEDYPESGFALPFLMKVLYELRALEQENLFDRGALRAFALHVSKVYKVAEGVVAQRRREYLESLEEEEEWSSSSSSDEDEEVVEHKEGKSSFANSLKLKTASKTKRVYRRRGSFSYQTSVGTFHIPGTQAQIDLHQGIVDERQASFRGNRVKVRLSLFWVAASKLGSASLSGPVTEETTYRSADYLSKGEKEKLVPDVRALLRTVGNPYEKSQMGTLLHSERDLVVKLDKIADFAGKVKKEIRAKAPRTAKLLVLALEVHSHENKVCGRCDSVLRSLSTGGWKADVLAGLDADYDVSEFRIIVRAGSDSGGGEEVVGLTKKKEGTLETFTPDTLPSLFDIQPLDRMKYFPELQKFSDQIK